MLFVPLRCVIEADAGVEVRARRPPEEQGEKRAIVQSPAVTQIIYIPLIRNYNEYDYTPIETPSCQF